MFFPKKFILVEKNLYNIYLQMEDQLGGSSLFN